MCQSPCISIPKSLVLATSLKYCTHSSIRGTYLSQYLAKKNTNANAIQCSGMLEVVHCSLVKKQRQETCLYAFFRFSMTTPERGQGGPSARTTYIAFARVDGQSDGDARPSPFIMLFRCIQNVCTLSIGCSDPCSRMVVGAQQICCTLMLCCVFYSYTHFSLDGEGLVASIGRINNGIHGNLSLVANAEATKL